MTTTATITSTEIVVADRNDAGLLCEVVGTEGRPATFADADIFLATLKLGRVGKWELDADGNVSVVVTEVDNEFNGVRAARLWEKVGTTHSEFDLVAAETVRDGDLISDRDLSAAYVVAGSNVGTGVKVHAVAEGKTWNDRYTSNWGRTQRVMVARKR